LKEEALDRTMWRNRFGRGFGPVVWQITDDDDDIPADNLYCCTSTLWMKQLHSNKGTADMSLNTTCGWLMHL